jgi:hypothetical protein
VERRMPRWALRRTSEAAGERLAARHNGSEHHQGRSR